MNVTVDPESRRALALTDEPSGAITRTQVINKTFELILVVTALDADVTGSVFEG